MFPAAASHASTADSAASRHCQNRNLAVPGAATPSDRVLASVKSAGVEGRLACFAWTRRPGAVDPAEGSLGMKLIDMRGARPQRQRGPRPGSWIVRALRRGRLLGQDVAEHRHRLLHLV